MFLPIAIPPIRATQPAARAGRAIIGLLAALACVCTWLSPVSPAAAQDPAPKTTKTKEERHTRHILVETEAEADGLIKRVEAGEDFMALCREFSLDSVTKKIGGDLDWLRKSDTAPIEKAVFSIPKVNGVAKAKTPYGWHVVQFFEQRFIETQGGEEKPTAEKNAKKKPDITREGDLKLDKKVTNPDQKKLEKPITGGEEKEKKRRVRNEDLGVTLTFDRATYHAEDEISFTIEIKNKTQGPLNVFNPLSWPLGLNGRYHGNPEANFDLHMPKKGEGAVPPDQLVQELAGGESLKHTFTLGDYEDTIETWPVIRFNWRGDELLKGLEKNYPEIAKHKDFGTWKERWTSYASAAVTFSVLPEYEAGAKWYARFIFGAATSNVWVELTDPKVPGLMEHWIQEAASGCYSRSSLTKNEQGTYLLGGEKNPPPKPFTLPPGAKPAELAPYTLAVATGEGAGAGNVDMRLFFTLADPSPVKGKAIPIGKVVQNTELLDAIAKGNADARQVRPEITLIELYPDEAMPTNIRDTILHGNRGIEPLMPEGERKRMDLDVPAPAPTGLGEHCPIVEMVIEDAVVKIELFEDLAPNTVANFITLVDKSFYDGLNFHSRSEDDKNLGWIQGGSPNGKDTGHLDFAIKDEFMPAVKHDKGVIAMAGNRNGAKDSASCQFFICFAPQPALDGKFTVFGRVIDGLSELERLPVPATIRTVRVVERRPHEYQPERTPQAK